MDKTRVRSADETLPHQHHTEVNWGTRSLHVLLHDNVLFLDHRLKKSTKLKIKNGKIEILGLSQKLTFVSENAMVFFKNLFLFSDLRFKIQNIMKAKGTRTIPVLLLTLANDKVFLQHLNNVSWYQNFSDWSYFHSLLISQW